jgi:F-type H+-transporting ATPase subunit b
MLIDWFTVGAQALNFLVLVWLLKRFLYRPILNAIDAREKRIAAELADADARKAEARQERDAFQRKTEELEQQRAALISEASDAARAERQRLLEQARSDADALATKRRETLRSEAENLNQAIVRRTQQEVFAIARKALTDLASTTLEQSMVEAFIRKLSAIDSATKAGLADMIAAQPEPVLVRSAFDLPEAQRSAIGTALNQSFAAQVAVRFEVAPSLVSGIELVAGGRKLAWSIGDYLASLEAGVADLVNGDKPAAGKAAERAAEPS